MCWQEWSERLKKELRLAAHPVAVTLAGAPGAVVMASQGKVSVCQALKRARECEHLTGQNGQGTSWRELSGLTGTSS